MYSEIELHKLQARLADIENCLQQLRQLRKPKSGDSLLKERFWEREKKKLLLAIDLVKQKELIPPLERAHEKSKTPEVKRMAKAAHEGQLLRCKEVQQKRAQGRAMGSGTTSGTWRSEATPTKVPAFVDPEVGSRAALTSARKQIEYLEIELRSLVANDQEWRDLVSPSLNLEMTTPDPDLVRASFDSLFLNEAYELRMGNKLDTMALLKGCSEKNPDRDQLFMAKHRISQSQLGAWLNSLGEFADKQVRTLALIAVKKYCGRGQDAAHWARVEVQQLLRRSLGQEISALGEKAEGLIEPPSVDMWSRWVCEGMPDFDVSESGFPVPWTAPVWYDDLFDTKLWIRHGRPERLTVEQTERLSRSYRRLFSGRLHHNLDAAEHRARLELAGLGALDPSDKSQLELKMPAQVSIQSNLPAQKAQLHSPQLQLVRKQFVDPILNSKGWSIHDWSVQSDVDFHTADDYLKGKSRPYPSTRKKLAISLGVAVEALPV